MLSLLAEAGVGGQSWIDWMSYVLGSPDPATGLYAMLAAGVPIVVGLALLWLTVRWVRREAIRPRTQRVGFQYLPAARATIAENKKRTNRRRVRRTRRTR